MTTKRADSEHQSYSEWTCLDWYDGPLTEIALVTFHDDRKLVEIKTQGGWVGKGYRVGHDRVTKFFDNHMRFDRVTLVAMLDLLDGKNVPGFFEDEDELPPTLDDSPASSGA